MKKMGVTASFFRKSYENDVKILRSQVIIFEKRHVEDARNHARHRRRDTARLTTNETALESA